MLELSNDYQPSYFDFLLAFGWLRLTNHPGMERDGPCHHHTYRYQRDARYAAGHLTPFLRLSYALAHGQSLQTAELQRHAILIWRSLNRMTFKCRING